LPHVVNFDMPSVPADYLHRIGRTGRAGVDGVAINLVSPEERPQLADIERLLTKPIPREELPGGAAVPAARPSDGSRSRPSHRSSGSAGPARRRPGGRVVGWSGLPGERRGRLRVGDGSR
jgi:ATP-dependent RNA helicase RhlE